jgi:hypothetical protein
MQAESSSGPVELLRRPVISVHSERLGRLQHLFQLVNARYLGIDYPNSQCFFFSSSFCSDNWTYRSRVLRLDKLVGYRMKDALCLPFPCPVIVMLS